MRVGMLEYMHRNSERKETEFYATAVFSIKAYNKNKGERKMNENKTLDNWTASKIESGRG